MATSVAERVVSMGASLLRGSRSAPPGVEGVMGDRYTMKDFYLWENGKRLPEGPYPRRMAMMLAAAIRRKTGRRVYARGQK